MELCDKPSASAWTRDWAPRWSAGLDLTYLTIALESHIYIVRQRGYRGDREALAVLYRAARTYFPADRPIPRR